ncbi:MAG: peptide ABC transporter substrate-binding protein [Gemmatimonadetes bacterium]|nr:peptide ABC transporter substrate-binding protein [Gemmatimonadota bacterium]
MTVRFAIALLSSALIGCTAALAWPDADPPAPYTNSIGISMPPDAAPPEYQVFTSFKAENRYLDMATSHYQVIGHDYALVNEPLVRMDRDYNLLPAAATRWEVSGDGLTWTFHLQSDLIFADGHPLTAQDFEDTFKRWADPDTGFDFEWFYRSIRNWSEVVAAKLPLDSLGVTALDDHTIAFATEDPTPYLPLILTFSWVTPTHLFEKHGPGWSTRPETLLGSGPFRLLEWSKLDRIVLAPNPHYRGPHKPYLERVVSKLFNAAVPPPMLSSYEAGAVDLASLTNQAEINRVKHDAGLRDQLVTYSAFGTTYLMMDTFKPPFDDLRVRQAFSHAIDTEALVESALQGVAVPAVSMLPDGFPSADTRELSPVQRYDPGLARRLLAEAGYPDGSGFPQTVMWIRGTNLQGGQAPQAVQAMLKRNLNLDIGVQNTEAKLFMESMYQGDIAFAMIPYGYDYMDPSNLLGIWLSSGRHAWYNQRFESVMAEANHLIGDPERRLALYEEAERIVVEDVAGVFLWHSQHNELWKPYLRTEALERNERGGYAIRVDKHLNLSTTLYVTEEVVRVGAAEDLDEGLWDWLFRSGR